MVFDGHLFRQTRRLGTGTTRANVVGAQGEGGQRLFIIPALELIVAIIAGNYLKEDQGLPPARILRELILESLVL